MSDPQPTSLCIAVLTYLRPAMLQTGASRILEQMTEMQSNTAESHFPLSVELLVVDNDPLGSARAVADELDSPRLRYVVEPSPGISAARNRALREAADADLLLFIDDDEVPQDGWLQGMLRTRAAFQAELVAGAVVSKFEVEPGPWVAA